MESSGLTHELMSHKLIILDLWQTHQMMVNVEEIKTGFTPSKRFLNIAAHWNISTTIKMTACIFELA